MWDMYGVVQYTPLYASENVEFSEEMGDTQPSPWADRLSESWSSMNAGFGEDVKIRVAVVMDVYRSSWYFWIFLNRKSGSYGCQCV